MQAAWLLSQALLSKLGKFGRAEEWSSEWPRECSRSRWQRWCERTLFNLRRVVGYVFLFEVKAARGVVCQLLGLHRIVRSVESEPSLRIVAHDVAGSNVKFKLLAHPGRDVNKPQRQDLRHGTCCAMQLFVRARVLSGVRMDRISFSSLNTQYARKRLSANKISSNLI